MEYKFTTKAYGQEGDFGVEVEPGGIEVLREIGWWGWTPQEAQMIIDKSKALEEDDEFIYQVEGSDLLIRIFTDEVYFFDYRTEQETEDLLWTFDQFIDFMEQFKKFIEENS